MNHSSKAIAKQCPNVGGLAVYYAQSLLKAVDDDIEFDTDSLCILAGYRTEEETNTSKKINAEVNVFPNPAREYFTVNSNNKISSIKLYSITGELILNILPNNNTSTIDTKSLTNGLYIISVISDSKVDNIKLQIIK